MASTKAGRAGEECALHFEMSTSTADPDQGLEASEILYLALRTWALPIVQLQFSS